MCLPASDLVGVTATGDVVSGPGAPNILFNCLPVACIGDLVAGAVCIGAVSSTTAVTCLMDGRPLATLTSTVNGLNPITGVPVATVIAMTAAVNVLA